MLPSQVQIIPQYIFFSKIGWINSYLPLLVPRLGAVAHWGRRQQAGFGPVPADPVRPFEAPGPTFQEP